MEDLFSVISKEESGTGWVVAYHLLKVKKIPV